MTCCCGERRAGELRNIFFEFPSLPVDRRTVSFTITPDTLGLWNEDMRRVVEPGEFRIMAGTNSRDLQTTMLEVVEK